MKNVKRTFSVSAYLRYTWIITLLRRKCTHYAGLCLLVITCILGTTNVVSAANEFDGFLQFVRICVPELPPSRSKVSVKKQEEFKAVWTQVGIAGKELEAVWENEVKNDPLMRRALTACDRYGELEIQSNSLRQQLISQYGKQKFRELEAKGTRWLKNQQADWLDLKDERLVQLAVRVCKMNNYRSLIESEAFSQFIEGDKELTEKEAIAVYTAGIQWKRRQLEDEIFFPELSDLMRK